MKLFYHSLSSNEVRRVLYVEDDPINALVMKKLLQDHYEVVNACDGEACLEYLSRDKFDIVLMDINLGRGKMDGIQTLGKMKQQAGMEAIPVFAVTSYAMPEDEARFLKEGFDAYLSKPVERLALIERIGAFLARR